MLNQTHIHFLGELLAAWRIRPSDDRRQQPWIDDPLAQPDIAAMSMAEIADLPIDPHPEAPGLPAASKQTRQTSAKPSPACIQKACPV